MITCRKLAQLTLLLMGWLIVLVGYSHSSVEAVEIGTVPASSECAGEPNVMWVYKPSARGTNLILSVTVSCTDLEGNEIEKTGRAWWKCVNVGSEPVLKNGTALSFGGNSGLDCTGRTVRSIVKGLIGYTLPQAITVNNFYVQSYVQPFMESGTCADAYKGTIETYQSYLPVFNDGNITYRLNRTVEDDEFAIYMNLLRAYDYGDGSQAPHTFHSSAFVVDPAAIVRSHYIAGEMTHTEGYGTADSTVLNSYGVPDKTFELETTTKKIQLGYDDVNNDSIIDNYYCGYIIDLEIDPINPYGFD